MSDGLDELDLASISTAAAPAAVSSLTSPTAARPQKPSAPAKRGRPPAKRTTAIGPPAAVPSERKVQASESSGLSSSSERKVETGSSSDEDVKRGAASFSSSSSRNGGGGTKRRATEEEKIENNTKSQIEEEFLAEKRRRFRGGAIPSDLNPFGGAPRVIRVPSLYYDPRGGSSSKGPPGPPPPMMYPGAKVAGTGVIPTAGPYSASTGVMLVAPQQNRSQSKQHNIVHTFKVDPNIHEKLKRTENPIAPVGSAEAHTGYQNEMAFVVEKIGDVRTRRMPLNIQDANVEIITCFNGQPQNVQLRFVGQLLVNTKQDGFNAGEVAICIAGICTFKNMGWKRIFAGDYLCFSTRPYVIQTKDGIFPRIVEDGKPVDKFIPVLFPWTFFNVVDFETTLRSRIRSHLDLLDEKDNGLNFSQVQIRSVWENLRRIVETFATTFAYETQHCGHIIGYWLIVQELTAALLPLILPAIHDGTFLAPVTELVSIADWIHTTECSILCLPEKYYSMKPFDNKVPPVDHSTQFKYLKTLHRSFGDSVKLAMASYQEWEKRQFVGKAISDADIQGDVDTMIGVKP